MKKPGRPKKTARCCHRAVKGTVRPGTEETTFGDGGRGPPSACQVKSNQRATCDSLSRSGGALGLGRALRGGLDRGVGQGLEVGFRDVGGLLGGLLHALERVVGGG